MTLCFLGVMNRENVIASANPEWVKNNIEIETRWRYQCFNREISLSYPNMNVAMEKYGNSIKDDNYDKTKDKRIVRVLFDDTCFEGMGVGVRILLRMGLINEYDSPQERQKVVKNFIDKIYTKAELLQFFYETAELVRRDGKDIRLTFDKNCILITHRYEAQKYPLYSLHE